MKEKTPSKAKTPSQASVVSGGSPICDAGKEPPAPKIGEEEKAIITLRSVVKTFSTPAGDVTVLKSIDLDFKAGQFASVVGKSGSGKSTLINMVTGIDEPTSGDVIVNGVAIHKKNHSQMSVWRGKNLGIVFQFFQLLPMLSVLENVILPMDFCNMYRPEERAPRARALLKRMELGGFEDLMPAELSGGQQQCAAVARALANDPPIIVADEPTGNLDSHTAEIVFQTLLDLERQGKTIVMVTHDQHLAARTSRTVLICDGELVDETAATAFIGLPHDQLLWLTRHMSPITLPPGAPLAAPGQPLQGLYLLKAGCLLQASGSEQPAGIEQANSLQLPVNSSSPTALTPGGWLTALDPRFSAGWRAAGNEPAQLLALSNPDLEEWMSRSAAVKGLLQGTVQKEGQP
jgi:putative ABC transport system ATP-binding protein